MHPTAVSRLVRDHHFSGPLCALESRAKSFGELKMLLAAAATDAMRNGTERITEEIIDGCNYMSPSARKQRPAVG
jgi:hypothetical protein